jgi:hypothetical protein
VNGRWPVSLHLVSVGWMPFPQALETSDGVAGPPWALPEEACGPLLRELAANIAVQHRDRIAIGICHVKFVVACRDGGFSTLKLAGRHGGALPPLSCSFSAEPSVAEEASPLESPRLPEELVAGNGHRPGLLPRCGRRTFGLGAQGEPFG